MDSYQHSQSYYEAPESLNAFARYSQSLGIATIITAVFGTVYFPFILGGLAIILGILSRGRQKSLCRAVKIGLTTAVIGLAINVYMVISSVYLIFTVPEYRQILNDTYEQMYDQSFDEALEELTGGF